MRFLFLIPALALLSGCGEKWGSAAPYRPESEAPIPVAMPANAPFIGQQFLATDQSRDVAGHLGIDFWSDHGTPIIATAPGRVVRVFFDPAYGRRITVDHGTDENGHRVLSQYFHLSEFEVEVGDVVKRGEPIGRMGASGFLAGFVHLHFEILRGETRSKARGEDPNLFWANGIGRVTCFDPQTSYPDDRFVTVVPLGCRGGKPF